MMTRHEQIADRVQPNHSFRLFSFLLPDGLRTSSKAELSAPSSVVKTLEMESSDHLLLLLAFGLPSSSLVILIVVLLVLVLPMVVVLLLPRFLVKKGRKRVRSVGGQEEGRRERRDEREGDHPA